VGKSEGQYESVKGPILHHRKKSLTGEKKKGGENKVRAEALYRSNLVTTSGEGKSSRKIGKYKVASICDRVVRLKESFFAQKPQCSESPLERFRKKTSSGENQSPPKKASGKFAKTSPIRCPAGIKFRKKKNPASWVPQPCDRGKGRENGGKKAPDSLSGNLRGFGEENT